jgi:hypothetical protein
MNLNKHNANNKNINFFIHNMIPNLAKIKKERLKNDIWIGIRIHPYPELTLEHTEISHISVQAQSTIHNKQQKYG